MKVRTIVFFVLCAAILHAQTPDKMSYQAVVRNSAGELVKNTPIGMRISILQGSPTGTAVYTETPQNPTTNANGLVSIQFGGGAGFNAIDWSNGVYFLKTETDISGGMNYTIVGTSQLLSVPYSIHSKTAETMTGTLPYSQITGAPTPFSGSYNDLTNKPTLFSGNYNDLTNKPTLFSGNYNNLTNKPNLPDTVAKYGFSGDYNDLTNKPAANQPPTCSITAPANNATVHYGDTIKVTANDADGTIAEVQLFVDNKFFDGNIAAPYSFTAKLPLGTYTITAIARDDKGVTTKSSAVTNITVTLGIGMAYQGGIIAYIDGTGQHGLIAAPFDQSDGIQWYNGSYITTNATGTAIGTGQSNTTAIVAAQGAGSYAAKMCDDLVLNGYTDWFLPSKDELHQLFINRNLIGGFTTTIDSYNYWSSTDSNNSYAWRQGFSGTTGIQNISNKSSSFRVRACRYF